MYPIAISRSAANTITSLLFLEDLFIRVYKQNYEFLFSEQIAEIPKGKTKLIKKGRTSENPHEVNRKWNPPIKQ